MNISSEILRSRSLALIFATLVVCAGPAAVAQTAASAIIATQAVSRKTLDCTPQSQIDVSTIQPQIVLIGESHGTKEMPEFTSGLVCSLLKDGRSVILALERPAEEQESLQRYIESEGSATDRSALLDTHLWASRWQDGRSSEAMFALVESIRKLRKSGQRVGILAIQQLGNLKVPMTDTDSAPLTVADNIIHSRINDRVMADTLLAASVLYRNYTVVGLAGSAHTSTQKGSSRDADYLPMGNVLSAMAPTFIIGARHGGGEHWGMRARYGVYPLQSREILGEKDRVDATITIPKFTASSSANPAATALALSAAAEH